MRQLPPYVKSSLPKGRSGDWSIEKFAVRSSRQGDDRPACFRSRSGFYTRLKKGNEVFMTDLYDEWWTQRLAIEQSLERGGEVLVTGLGLGLVVTSMLEPPASRVERVIVIERSSDVIRLVAHVLEKSYNDRVEVINADAFQWLPQPGRRFSVVWHDIWPNPHAQGVMAQSAVLERRYAPFCDWQGSWVREYRATEAAERTARAG